MRSIDGVVFILFYYKQNKKGHESPSHFQQLCGFYHDLFLCERHNIVLYHKILIMSTVKFYIFFKFIKYFILDFLRNPTVTS